MFKIPEEYNTGLVTDKRRFPLSHLKPAERQRFRRSLKELVLDAVVKDDIIPSFVSDTDSVRAVQFFTADVDSLRSAPFVCGILQRMTKTPSVIKVRDEKKELYSFALKRLNLQDKDLVVVTDEFLTRSLTRGVSGTEDRLIQDFAGWDCIVNKTNLYSWYLEMMVKCYIITNRDLWSGMNDLLTSKSKVWYNTEDVLLLFEDVKVLVKLTEERGRSVTTGNASRINGELKRTYDKLKGYVN